MKRLEVINEENAEKIKTRYMIKSIKKNIVFFGMCIPVVIFLATVYGTFQLLYFSNDYQISFLDLAESRIIISYGLFFFFLTSVMIVFPFIIIIFNHYQGRGIYGYLSCNSRFKSGGVWPMFFLYAIMALWPFVFLVENGRYIKYFILIGLFLPIGFIVFCTKPRFWFFCEGKIEIMEIFFNILLSSLPSILGGMFSFYIIIIIMEDYLSNISGTITFLMFSMVSVVYFSISYGPALLSANNRNASTAILFYCVIFLAFFIFLSFQLHGLIGNIVARASGLGHFEQCYLKKEVQNIGIPDGFFVDVPDKENEIVRLFIIAKVDNKYYISRVKDENKEPIKYFTNKKMEKFIFISDKLKGISCPSKKEDKNKNL